MEKTDAEIEWLSTVREIRDYAQEQFDKLIVYLSSGGLILTVGFVKDLVKLDKATWLELLLSSWIGFIFSLVLILLSHKSAIKSTTLELKGNPKKSDKQDKLTNLLNWGAFGFLILAIIIFISFVTINLFKS